MRNEAMLSYYRLVGSHTLSKKVQPKRIKSPAYCLLAWKSTWVCRYGKSNTPKNLSDKLFFTKINNSFGNNYSISVELQRLNALVTSSGGSKWFCWDGTIVDANNQTFMIVKSKSQRCDWAWNFTEEKISRLMSSSKPLLIETFQNRLELIYKSKFSKLFGSNK